MRRGCVLEAFWARPRSPKVEYQGSFFGSPFVPKSIKNAIENSLENQRRKSKGNDARRPPQRHLKPQKSMKNRFWRPKECRGGPGWVPPRKPTQNIIKMNRQNSGNMIDNWHAFRRCSGQSSAVNAAGRSQRQKAILLPTHMPKNHRKIPETL